MKQYHCQFPLCNYQTNERSQIHIHHIKPKEQSGSDDKWNTIWTCPNHHSKIYIPNAYGIHATRGEDSIEVICWRNNGMILEYKDIKGNTLYSFKLD